MNCRGSIVQYRMMQPYASAVLELLLLMEQVSCPKSALCWIRRHTKQAESLQVVGKLKRIGSQKQRKQVKTLRSLQAVVPERREKDIKSSRDRLVTGALGLFRFTTLWWDEKIFDFFTAGKTASLFYPAISSGFPAWRSSDEPSRRR